MAWHTIDEIGNGVYRISEPFGAIEPRVGVTTVNMYVVVGRERIGVIDTGFGVGDLPAVVASLSSGATRPPIVLNTHSDWDHIGANVQFPELAIHALEAEALTREPDLGDLREQMATPSARAALPEGFDPSTYRVLPKPATRILADGDTIDLGDRVLRALHTPGHSPGHLAYHDEANGVLFTGDTAYEGPVIACFPSSDPEALLTSVRRLASLPGVRIVCGGHEEVITKVGWLKVLAQCVEAACTGKVEGQPREGFLTGRQVSFGRLSIWLPRLRGRAA